jgi:hypothetical protein
MQNNKESKDEKIDKANDKIINTNQVTCYTYVFATVYNELPVPS